MADIYKINSDNIVGGPGRLVYKNFDGTFPDSIEDVMDVTSPYELKPGWYDLGATNDGISTTRGFDTEDFEVDQVVGAVDTDITSWTHTLETTLAENSIENRQLSLIGGTIIETPPVLGEAVPVTTDLAIGATIVSLTDAKALAEGQFLQFTSSQGVESKQISRIQGNTVYLKTPLEYAYTKDSTIKPVTTPGFKRIGFGTVNNIPFLTFALISQKKDGSLYMCVIRKGKVNGDDKEQTYGREKRTIPLSVTAFPDDHSIQEENVYYEIEQVI